MQIVIADDNDNLREVLRDVFLEKGYFVDQVKDGYELLSYLKNKKPELIILDLIMPPKNGTEILSAIKCLAPTVKIIIYTGFEQYEHTSYAGMVDKFLLKSTSPENLLKAVEELRLGNTF